MKSSIGSLCLVGAMSVGAAGFAQNAAQTPQSEEMRRKHNQQDSTKQITLTGCVQSEEEYRRVASGGQRGALGSGGVSRDEFVLVDAVSSPAGDDGVGTSGKAGDKTGKPAESHDSSPTGAASKTPSSGVAYRLAGSGEAQAGRLAGKRVEITGKIEAAGATRTGHDGASPTGMVAVDSKDLLLGEIDVTSVREVGGTCPANAR